MTISESREKADNNGPMILLQLMSIKTHIIV